jgi:hypothetical protein
VPSSTLSLHALQNFSLAGIVGLQYLPVSIARLCALNLSFVKKERTYLLILNVRYFCSSKVARTLLKNLFSCFRLSAHSLAIETGRYCKPTIPANEKFCKACKDKVEDEHHFLIECPIYNSVRDKFFTLFNRKFNENLIFLKDESLSD